MYVCSICKQVTQPRVPQHKLTTYKDWVHPLRTKPVLTKKGQPVYRWHKKMFPEYLVAWSDEGHLLKIIDFGGVGKQIASEKPVCPCCRR
jgi:hypothetical protein